MSSFRKSARLPDPAEALPGRNTPMAVAARHAVLGTPLTGPFPAHLEGALFGLGCFWGAERLFVPAWCVHNLCGLCRRCNAQSHL